MSLPQTHDDMPPADRLARELIDLVVTHLAARGVGSGRSEAGTRAAVRNIRAAIDQVGAEIEMAREGLDFLDAGER